MGRAGSRAHIGPDDDTLRALGIKVHWVNRGGGCVFHLPGQLSAYFALSLETFGLTVGDYVDRLHTAIVLVLEEFDLTGTFRPGIPGVFSGQARIATVGVAVTRWIAYHGLTLNVGPYLEMFDVAGRAGHRPGAAAKHVDGSPAAAAYRDVQGSRGFDAPAGRGLRRRASSRLHPPPDDPAARFSRMSMPPHPGNPVLPSLTVLGDAPAVREMPDRDAAPRPSRCVPDGCRIGSSGRSRPRAECRSPAAW